MSFYLLTSPARREFKKHLGSANHLIITALVGLDAIEKGLVTTIPEEFRAAWSPQDQVASSRRSRQLILDMALVRCVDSLDLYIRHASRKPFLIQSSEIQSKLNENGRSIYKRFEILEDHYTSIDKKLSALVALVITWRNRAVHSDADNEVRKRYKNYIRDNTEAIKEKFRGLDSVALLERYDNQKDPRFKEVASFIYSTHLYVEELEQSLFQSICPERFLRELLWTRISKDEASDRRRKQLLKSIWGKSHLNKERAIKSFLERQGLSFIKPEDKENFLFFDNAFLEKMLLKTPTQMFNWIKPAE